jgi:hypothetical protein
MRLSVSSQKVLAVALVAFSISLLAGGAPQASNMGFKMNKVIQKGGGDPVGTNWVALPYRNPYVDAQDFCNALGLVAPANIHVTIATGTTADHTCGAAGPFVFNDVVAGNDYRRIGVVVLDAPATVSGILVGSHAGGAPGINIYAGGDVGDPVGRNDYPVLYHGTAATASDVCNDLVLDSVGGPGLVAHIQRNNAANGAISDFFCGAAGAFALVLGESVRITNEPVNHIGVVVPHF